MLQRNFLFLGIFEVLTTRIGIEARTRSGATAVLDPTTRVPVARAETGKTVHLQQQLYLLTPVQAKA